MEPVPELLRNVQHAFSILQACRRVACEIRALSEESQKSEFQGGIASELSRPTGMHLPYPYHKKIPCNTTDATRVSRVAAGNGGDFPCCTCYIAGARPSERTATSMLHLRRRAARVARRIGSLGAACGLETEREGSESSNFACYTCYMPVASKNPCYTCYVAVPEQIACCTRVSQFFFLVSRYSCCMTFCLSWFRPP